VKVTVDRTRCVGTGICEVTAPPVFELDDNAELAILQAEIGPDQLEAVRTAVSHCPTQALTLTD
jgi:ferredoxin